MRNVRHHYDRTERETASRVVLSTDGLRPPLWCCRLTDWTMFRKKHCASPWYSRPTWLPCISTPEKVAAGCHRRSGDLGRGARSTRGSAHAQTRGPQITYRFIVTPILNFVFELERKHTDRQIAVLLPTLVERHWYQHFLHNQYGELLTAHLLLKGNKRIVIVNIPWYLKA